MNSPRSQAPRKKISGTPGNGLSQDGQLPPRPVVSAVRFREICQAIERIEQHLAADLQTSPGFGFRDTPKTGYWSAEIFQLYGFQPNGNAPPMDLIQARVLPRDAARLAAETRRAFQERTAINIEYRIRLANGSLRTLHSDVRPVFGHFGHDFAMAGVVRDITAIRTACAALQDIRQELKTGCEPASTARPALNPATCPAQAGQNAWHSIRDGASHWIVERILRLITEQFPAGISVAEMARAAGTSPSHFSRVFKQITGATPHQFLLHQRLEKAKAALTGAATCNIAEVAAHCGFFDQAHLSRHFRKKYGMTPGELLRRNGL